MRVMIAEDSIFRKSIADMLSTAGHDVVFVAKDGDELLAHLNCSGPPDVAVLDIRMPPKRTDEGLVAAERIRARWPATGILLFSAYMLVAMARRLLDLDGSGGLGYLSKNNISDAAELSAAVQRIGAGEQVLDQQLVGDLLRRRREKPLEELLTARELEVLALIVEGRTNKAIAQSLVLSVKAVEDNSSSVFRKLGVTGDPEYNQRVRAVLEFFRRTE
jgi:DNA-binding NarL/FixJ family response regulator